MLSALLSFSVWSVTGDFFGHITSAFVAETALSGLYKLRSLLTVVMDCFLAVSCKK